METFDFRFKKKEAFIVIEEEKNNNALLLNEWMRCVRFMFHSTIQRQTNAMSSNPKWEQQLVSGIIRNDVLVSVQLHATTKIAITEKDRKKKIGEKIWHRCLV